MSDRAAGRGHAFERLIRLEPKARLTSGLWWITGYPLPIPSTVYGINAESCQHLLWHVARAARGVSQIFLLLFLGNGWADCAQIELRHDIFNCDNRFVAWTYRKTQNTTLFSRRPHSDNSETTKHLSFDSHRSFKFQVDAGFSNAPDVQDVL